jgi:hypothetical protein
MRALRTSALLIALACTSTAHADAQKEAPLSEFDAEKVLAFYNELVDSAVKNAADCGALAGAVNGVVDRHMSAIQLTWAAKKANKALPRDVQAKMDKRALELVGALRKCLDDEGVKAAFKRMKVPEDKKK